MYFQACSEHSTGHHQRRSVTTSTSSPSGTPPLSPVHKTVDHQEHKKILEEERIAASFPDLSVDYISKKADKEIEHHQIDIQQTENQQEDQLLKELQKEFDLININNPIVSFEEVSIFVSPSVLL